MRWNYFLLWMFCGVLVVPGKICGQEKRGRDLTYVIAADLHFDFLPESDQYYHVVAMNRLPGNFVMPSGDTVRHVDGVILAGDLFDRSRPEILDLFRARYECGNGAKQIHYPVYPGLGNHDLDIVADDKKPNTEQHLSLIKNYVDTLLRKKLEENAILNLHPSSRSYSWNAGDVHFIHGQRYAGDTSYCESNLEWLKSDLKKYASNGNPVVYIQHYGVDEWALRWWSQDARNKLFGVFDEYNVVAILVGHTHTPLLKTYRGYPVYQVNNAWPDKDGNGSFAVLNIRDNQLEIASCRWLDSCGNFEVTGPFLKINTSFLKKKEILTEAFSHNDYWRENPLKDALSFRFNNVEADLWLIGDEIYVGHEPPEPHGAITLSELYLRPLIARIEQNRGRVYPDIENPFLLMLDFKHHGEDIYEKLKEQLKPYKNYFCRMEDGKYVEGPILLCISGNRPLKTLPSEKNRIAFLDGQIKDLDKQISNALMPIISDDYKRYFTWDGYGEINEDEYERMKQLIEKVHTENKMFRWWGAPETRSAKKLFKDIGVDLIGTDDLNMLYNVLVGSNI